VSEYDIIEEDPHSSREINLHWPDLPMGIQQRGTCRDLLWPLLELSRTSRR
jgi:hypothetical protein